MKKAIIGFVCILLLLNACNKKIQQTVGIENTTNTKTFIEIQEDMDKIVHDNTTENLLTTELSSNNEKGNIINLEHLEIDSIKQMFIGNWIAYGLFFTIYNDGRYEEGLLETSYGASGYWEINDDQFIITINHRSEDYGQWDLYRRTLYDFSFIDDTLVLTFVETVDENGTIVPFDLPTNRKSVSIRLDNDRNIFGDYPTHAGYVWESYLNYVKRFGRYW